MDIAVRAPICEDQIAEANLCDEASAFCGIVQVPGQEAGEAADKPLISWPSGAFLTKAIKQVVKYINNRISGQMDNGRGN